MYTQCPHCQAVFRVTTAELTLSDGQVRCGECLTVFNGMDSLSVLPPEDEQTQAEDMDREKARQEAREARKLSRASQPEVHAPPDSEAPGAPDVSEVPGEEPESRGKPPVDPLAESAPEPAADIPQTPAHALVIPTAPRSAPRVLQEELQEATAVPKRRAILGTLALGGLCALLIGLLSLQVLYHERERLGAYPEVAPMVNWLCNRLNCSTPERRDPDAFQITQRNIYSHPNAQGALMIQASFINQAGFSQPPPRVELSFRDLQGELLAVRRFNPEQYLPPSQAPHSIAPREGLDFSLEILDPGPRAVAYEFRFL
ncbi:MAG: DUF3426 domain-containing protein [Thioalkalivibrio sp.]